MAEQISEFDQLGELFSAGLNLYLNWARQKGLSANEFYVLYRLSLGGDCTQKDIAEEWSIPKQTVSVVCKQFLEKGYLQYTKSSTDKREKKLSLTELGKAVAMPIVMELSAIEQRTAEQFGKEQLSDLLNNLVRLQRLFAENLEK